MCVNCTQQQQKNQKKKYKRQKKKKNAPASDNRLVTTTLHEEDHIFSTGLFRILYASLPHSPRHIVATEYMVSSLK